MDRSLIKIVDPFWNFPPERSFSFVPFRGWLSGFSLLVVEVFFLVVLQGLEVLRCQFTEVESNREDRALNFLEVQPIQIELGPDGFIGEICEEKALELVLSLDHLVKYL